MLAQQFIQIIRQQVPQQHQFLIGFSGGVDSTVLLHLFAKLREKQPHLQLRAIHIHHGLSPNADQWAKHCQQYCAQLSIPCIVKKVKVLTQKGIEGGAREARYQAISTELLPQELFVTAHHQQDQIETFFLALKRGSGLQGLGGMQTQSLVYNLPIFRPLLKCRKEDIETYAKKQNLSWIEDESNQDHRYERNFLRHEILPRLQQRWVNFEQAVERSALHCVEQQNLINELLREEFYQYFNQIDHTFNVQHFPQLSLLKQKALLRLWLAECNFMMPSIRQLEQIIQNVIFAKSDRNPQFQLEDRLIRRYQQQLFVTPFFADLQHIRLPIKLEQTINLPDQLGLIRLEQEQEHFLIRWQKQGQIDLVRLPPTVEPIEIRFTYHGKIKLTANTPHKDIKKIWQLFKVPVWQRQRIPLIFYGEKLKSAVGFFYCF